MDTRYVEGEGARPTPPPRPSGTTGGPTPAAGGRQRVRRWRLGVAAAVLLLAAAAGWYWWATRNLESTDDAFVDGNAILIAPRVGGTVVRLHVGDNQRVQAGDLLLELDPRDYQATLDDALARLAEAEAGALSAAADLRLIRASTDAQIALARSGLAGARAEVERMRAEVAARQAENERAQASLPRYENLARQNAASREALDQAVAAARTGAANVQAAQLSVQSAVAAVAEAQARLDQAETAPQQIAVKEAAVKEAAAQVEAARARVDQGRLDLSYTRISAPAEGWVTRRSVNEGDNVRKDQSLITLVSGLPWITANFKETQLGRMRPGQPVDISIDTWPGHAFRGRVDSIQRGTGARFSLLPAENATGNYVKVVQRVPVKIVFDEAPPAHLPISLGMSVVPTVDVGADPPAVPPGPGDVSPAASTSVPDAPAVPR